MKRIETNIFEQVEDRPGMVRIVGRKKAVDVFAELESALKEANLLPDDYFLLDAHFKDEKCLIPALRDVVCMQTKGVFCCKKIPVLFKGRESDRVNYAFCFKLFLCR